MPVVQARFLAGGTVTGPQYPMAVKVRGAAVVGSPVPEVRNMGLYERNPPLNG